MNSKYKEESEEDFQKWVDKEVEKYEDYIDRMVAGPHVDPNSAAKGLNYNGEQKLPWE